MPDPHDIVDPAPLTAQDKDGRLIPRQDVPAPVQQEVEKRLDQH